MFNAAQKERFIESKILLSTGKQLAEYKRTIRNFFDRLEAYEERSGKDFADMDYDEINQVLEDFLSGGKSYQTITVSNLSNYMQWAIKNGLTHWERNIVATIDINRLTPQNSCRNSMVVDEDELTLCASDALRPLQEDTIDNLYWCIIYLLYAGLTREDIMNLKSDDVFLDESEIHFDKYLFKMSKRLKKTLKYYSGMDGFVHSASENAKGIRVDPIVRSEYFVCNSTTSDRKQMASSTFVSLSKKFKACRKRLTPSSVNISGVFRRMYDREKNGQPEDYSEYLFLKRNTAFAILNSSKVIEDCKYEYRAWKQAFDLN